MRSGERSSAILGNNSSERLSDAHKVEHKADKAVNDKQTTLNALQAQLTPLEQQVQQLKEQMRTEKLEHEELERKQSLADVKSRELELEVWSLEDDLEDLREEMESESAEATRKIKAITTLLISDELSLRFARSDFGSRAR